MNPKGNLWYRFWRWTVHHVAYAALGGLRVLNAERVPKEGPVLYLPVHMSYLDPPLIGCASPRAIRYMAKQELFKGLGGVILRSVNSFPVKRGANDTEAIRKAIEFLQAGETLLVFPEGTRNDGVTLGPITPGAAMLAKRTGAQVVVVGVSGTEKVWPRGAKKVRRARMTVAFSEPFTFEGATEGFDGHAARERFAQVLESKLIEECRRAGIELRTAARSPRQDTSDPARTPSEV